MSASLRQKGIYGLLVFLLTFVSGAARAEDTEIYFNSPASGNIALRPNVLLILDTSISMSQDVPDGSQSRMAAMKQAMAEILGSAEEVNVGLMRFNGTEGGSVLFPVSYIDDPVGNVVSEASNAEITYKYSVIAGDDDAQETLSSGDVDLAATTLNIPNTPVTYDSASPSVRTSTSGDDAYEFNNEIRVDAASGNTVNAFWNSGGFIQGLRFSGINVPQGARIDSATLDLWGIDTDSDAVTTTIYGDDIDDSLIFNSGDPKDITNRDKTTASISWNVPGTTPGTMFTSPDISNIIKEIVDRPGWAAGNALTLIAPQGSGTRRFHSFDGTTDTSLHPRLNISYTDTSAVIVPSESKVTGLHFDEVAIPQGATITSAKLVFTSTSTTGGDGAKWAIQADDSDDSAAITATNGDLSDTTARPRTTADVVWAVPDMVAEESYTTCNSGTCSGDLKDVVQEVVNRAGWCGGNAMTFLIGGTGNRNIYSAEAGKGPQLEISYDATQPSGCYRDTETAQVATSYDDVEELGDGTIRRTETNLDLSSNIVGLRFQNLDIPQNATILEAHLSVNTDLCSRSRRWGYTCTNTQTSGNPSIDIYGELAGNSAQFGNSTNELSSRSKTSTSVSWSLPDFTTNEQWFDSPDISGVIQQVVNQSGWASGNAMSFILNDDNQARTIESWDGEAGEAAKLTVFYESTASGTQIKTVRERLNELVEDMPTSDYTPIVESLYEASHYWRGESIRYGLNRDGIRTRISHPGSYCSADGVCNGADTGNYPPYGIYEPSGCSTSNLNDFDCYTRHIEGSPDYISPFKTDLTCASNYQVLLTDGEANSNSIASTIESEYLGGTSCLTSKSDGSSVTSGEECGIDLAGYLNDNDQSSTLDNDQTVQTYTIGFDLQNDPGAVQFLKDIAQEGGGEFFEAASASELVDTFNTILHDVRSDPTSFVSPSLATNAFNRLLSRDEIYFGLFTPSFEQSWPGNVKKYNICVDTSDQNGDGQPDCTLGEILDANGDTAIDSATDKFKSTSQSEWSDVVDGRETVRGGSGGEITDYTTRIVYTDATTDGSVPVNGTPLGNANHVISQSGSTPSYARWDSADNSHIRDAICPVNSTDTGTPEGLECQERMLWLLGKIVDPDPDSDTSATTRWSVNDVLHSSPAVVTYGGSDSDGDGSIDTFFDRLVVGTNNGGLRFINGDTGEEEWMFMPESVFSDQDEHFFNPEGDHLYGLDVTPTLQVNDVDGDGFIEPADGDFVHVFVAMRRGGDYIYGLDITPAAKLTDNTTEIVPKFMWRINGSTAGFERLADTWSQPRVATIATNAGKDIIDVLVFGGGYDSALDSDFGMAATSNNNNSGNAVYLVDPDDGSKLLSISGDCPGGVTTCSDKQVTEMHYSIPSRITILDTDGDGLDDRLYFGDTGGQVWRVDLGADINTGSDILGSTIIGRLASVSTAGTPADERRFFEPPAVVQVKDSIYSDAANGEYDYVMIGSGNRAHPLDKAVQDRFYAFRDKFVDGMPDSDNDNLADSSYPQTGGPISHSISDNLVDVTSTTLDSSNTTHVQAMGWYYDFESAGSDGEKVLSAPTAIAGAVFFTSYEPDVISSNTCSANIGGGNAYDFNILTTKAAIDWDEDGTLEDFADRKRSLGGGIPSDVVPVFTKEGVVGIVGVEGGASQLGALTGLPRYRTYWYQEM